ncbi:hypothetical protein [Corallococcus aberystwythensis]|uniref:hypothetical protein n=1 Tax=Corallococcus aberystwythensis TaxID=2316722 RepID=UPI0011C444AF|nr:hypothetical protein [Corallococcus aberystwythensis]
MASKKLTEKKLKTLKEHREGRDGSSFIMSFLLNTSRVTKNIRTVSGGRSAEATNENKRHFVIGLVSCMETFFRDMFIYCLDARTDLLAAYLDELKPIDVENMRASGIPLSEQLSAGVSFQNLDSVEKGFRHFFPGNGGVLDRLNSLERVVSIPSRAEKGLARVTLPQDSREVLSDLLQLRHRLVHDANYNPDFAPQALARYEAYVTLIAQFFHFAVAESLTSHRIIVDQNGVPVMFLVEDLIADDWEVVPDKN